MVADNSRFQNSCAAHVYGKVGGQDVDGPYRFGDGGITFEDLVLLELRRVSVASFQPVLGIRARANNG